MTPVGDAESDSANHDDMKSDSCHIFLLDKIIETYKKSFPNDNVTF